MVTHRARRGIALLNVLVFAFLMVAALSAATRYVSDTMRASRRNTWDQQAYQVAMSGLTHAIGWLNKQATQPVEAFDPRSVPLDAEDGADVEAKDENLGLVGEFPIDEAKGLWARYEICRSANAPNRDGLASGPVKPSYAAASLYPANAAGLTWRARDISETKGLVAGSTWRLRSKAYVWVKPTPGTNWGTVPPLKQLTLQADVDRLSLTPPTASITYFSDVNGVRLDVATSSPDAIVVQPLDGPPATSIHQRSAASFFANTSNVPVGPADLFDDASIPDSIEGQLYAIFGVRNQTSLEVVADEVYRTGGETPIPAEIKGGKFFYFEDSFDLDNAHLLDASGILYCGNQILVRNGFHKFRGLVFAARGLHMDPGARLSIRGALVTGNTGTRIRGDAAATSEVRYQESMLQSAKAAFEQYKIRHASVKVVD